MCAEFPKQGMSTILEPYRQVKLHGYLHLQKLIMQEIVDRAGNDFMADFEWNCSTTKAKSGWFLVNVCVKYVTHLVAKAYVQSADMTAQYISAEVQTTVAK